MVQAEDIQELWIQPYDVQLARWQALQATLPGGGSDFPQEYRHNSIAQRQDRNFIGQLATLAFHRWLTGGRDSYILSRWIANQDPRQGDGGSDFPALNVDVKASALSNRLSPLDHRLAVRPSCYHPDWVYALALVDEPISGRWRVQLVGWATTTMLPQPNTWKNKTSPFRGARTLRGYQLHPFPPFSWLWAQVGGSKSFPYKTQTQTHTHTGAA